MEVDEEGSSSALDAAAAAAELEVMRRKAAAVDALVRSGELPAEVRARALGRQLLDQCTMDDERSPYGRLQLHAPSQNAKCKMS
jgi:hypothetical protein